MVPRNLCKPKKVYEVSGKPVYLQWISDPFETADGKKMPICVSRDRGVLTIYIVWNEDIKLLNPDVINFVLWHEIGHIALDHYKHGGPRDEKVEAEADAFSRSHVGNIFFKREDIANFCRWFGYVCGKPEKITEYYIQSQCKRFGI